MAYTSKKQQRKNYKELSELQLLKGWLTSLPTIQKLFCQLQGLHLDLRACCCRSPSNTAGRLLWPMTWKRTGCASWQYWVQGTLWPNLKLCFSILIGWNQEQVAKSNLISQEFLHLGLHCCELEKYVEFELLDLDSECVSESLSLSNGPAAGVFVRRWNTVAAQKLHGLKAFDW